jgi:hypothetical protein
MIYDAGRLREVLEEIAGWTLEQRREYLAEIGKVFGPEAEQQLKDGLKQMWEQRK